MTAEPDTGPDTAPDVGGATSDAPAIRVVVADDHPVVREGLRSFLAARPGIEVVAEAATADEAVARAEATHPDVVLVDLMMPGDGVEAIHRLRQLPDPPRAIVLTSYTADDMVVPALRAGAAGYLLKDVDPSDLEAAIRTVHRGGALLAPSVAPHVLDRAVADRGGDPALDSLTAREREVLALLADGLSNRDIATALYVSEKTVKTHVSSILSKLHVTDRTQAALYAVRHDLDSGGAGR